MSAPGAVGVELVCLTRLRTSHDDIGCRSPRHQRGRCGSGRAGFWRISARAIFVRSAFRRRARCGIPWGQAVMTADSTAALRSMCAGSIATVRRPAPQHCWKMQQRLSSCEVTIRFRMGSGGNSRGTHVACALVQRSRALDRTKSRPSRTGSAELLARCTRQFVRVLSFVLNGDVTN